MEHADPSGPIRTIYLLHTWKLGGMPHVYNCYGQGISPLFFRLGDRTGFRLDAIDIFASNAKKTRDLTKSLLRFQRVLKRWVLRRRLAPRLAPRHLLCRELGGPPLQLELERWVEHALTALPQPLRRETCRQ